MARILTNAASCAAELGSQLVSSVRCLPPHCAKRPTGLRDGVTLAEMLLALGLCVVVVLLAISLGISALRASQKGTDQAVANAWAARVLEQFVYQLPPSTAPFWTSTGYASPYATDTIRLNSVDYRAQLFLEHLSSPADGAKLVTVNVTWSAGAQGHNASGVHVTEVSRLIYAH